MLLGTHGQTKTATKGEIAFVLGVGVVFGQLSGYQNRIRRRGNEHILSFYRGRFRMKANLVIGMKNCPHCTKLGLGPQPIARFSKHAQRPDGLQDQCRAAAAESYQKRTYGKSYVQPKQRIGPNGNLHDILDALPAPRYDNLSRMALQIAQGKFDNLDLAAKWLGMKPKSYQFFLLKFRVPVPGGEKNCVHEIRKETCHFCRGKG